MSFSSQVKEEISKLPTLKDKEMAKMELFGYHISHNFLTHKNNICFSTENEYNINRFAKLLSNLQIEYQIGVKGNLFTVTAKKELFDKIWQEIEVKWKQEKIGKEEKEKLEKALIRGAFLGGGSFSEPTRRYHLEIVLLQEEDAKLLVTILKNYDIQSKVLKREKACSVYIKDGEEISRMLAFMGASKAVLKFEEIRVIRDMRNSINRKVNCETANLKKTVDTGVRQVESIKLIMKKKKFEELPETLKEIAKLRIKNPSISLAELGKLLKEPIGKSGVNHRLKKLEEIAEELRK